MAPHSCSALPRRRFLRYLLASPLAAAAGQNLTSMEDILNVPELEAAARQALPAAHFGYLATGVEDDQTLRANVEGYQRYYLRPRRLIDISGTAGMDVELFGEQWDFPAGLAPIGNMKAFHEEGEVAMARAARAEKTQAMLSTWSNTSVEEVARELGHAPWYQLYPTSRWEVTQRLVKRAADAGCRVMALTVDTQAGRRTETFERLKRLDKRPCAACHGTKPEDFYRRKPMVAGIDVTGLRTSNPAMNWEQIPKLRQLSSMKLLLKGIETAEDAVRAVEAGMDGVIVSNHGGRAGESGRGTVECLPEVVEAVAGRIPVLLDGGIRRGSDIFKALALGARAVFVGRPYIWGLAAYGQPGAQLAIRILRTELQLVMKQCGARSLQEISRSMVGRRA